MSSEHHEPSTASAGTKAGGRSQRGRGLAMLALLAVAVGGGYYWYRTTFQVEGDRPLVVTATVAPPMGRIG